MRLSPRDFDALQGAILELYDYRDAAAFREATPKIFLRMIPAEDFIMVDADVDVAARTMRATDVWETSPRIKGDAIARMERAGWNHPFTQHAMKTGNLGALKFSDFFSMREFRSSELYDEFYRHVSVERLLGAMMLHGPTSVSTINTIRRSSEKDFSERDRLMLNLLRPHFDLARRNAERVTARRAERAESLESYRLTPRQQQVAEWLAKGKTNLEISLILDMRVRTVEKHVENILGKLSVENRTAAAVMIAASNEVGEE